MNGTIFEKIRFRNFMSFGALWTEVLLNEKGTTHIVGENLDEGGSSGAGKTTVLSAISYCIFDKVPSGISKDRLINTTNDKKNTSMEVELTFSKDGDRYRVLRRRGASTGVNFYKLTEGTDGGIVETDITPSNVSVVNSTLEELLGFSYDLFSQIILFSGGAKPFLDLPLNNQRNLIEELFKITALSKKARSLKTLIAATEKAIDVEKVLIKQTELRAEEQQRHLSDAEQRVVKWDQQRAQEINQISETLDALSTVDFEAEEKNHEMLKELEAEQGTLEARIAMLRQERNLKSKQRSPRTTDGALISSEIHKKNSDLDKLTKEMVHLRDAKCPYCLQKYDDAQKKIDELDSSMKTLNAELADLKLRLSQVNREIDEFDRVLAASLKEIDGQVSELQSQSNEGRERVQSLKSLLTFPTYKQHLEGKSSIDQLSQRLQEMTVETNPHLDSRDSLANEAKIIPSSAELDRLIKEKEHQTFLHKLLTDKNSFIRKNIISKTIPFLNKRIAYYTQKLNLPHIVLFQPDMSAHISQYGRELDHGNLSNGEKKKLNLSLCLSFRDVLTYLHSKVNVLFTDEVDGGSISGQDVDLLIGLLKHKAWDEEISIFVVSHRPEFEGRCDRSLTVRKDGGFSTLIYNVD